MAAAKEIRTKIRSIQNTQKITKAMEMVAASKMRRAQDLMLASRPYAEKIRSVVANATDASTDYVHPYLQKRAEVKRVGFIIVTTDRGLCGGLNVNLLKATVASISEWAEKGVEIDVCIIGKKGAGLMRRLPVNIVAEISELGDKPKIEDLLGSVKVMLDNYESGIIDRLFLVENKFVNTMTQQSQVTSLIPAETALDESENASSVSWDYEYEPDAATILDHLMKRYIETQVYQGVVENVACEMAARMVAMKSASDNAGNLISELQLVYNKARQAAITQEISEIVSGASAV